MTTTAPRFVAVAAFALFGASAARGTECFFPIPPVEAAFDVGVELPRNTELRFVDPVGQIGEATLFSGPTPVAAIPVLDDLGTVMAPDQPLAPGGYRLDHPFGTADFVIGETDDVTPPGAPVVSIEHDPPPPFRLDLSFLFDCPSTPPDPEFVLHVDGDEGDIVIVDGEARVVVRDGNASVRVSRRTVEVQLRDFAGNTSETTTVDLTREGGCSQGGSASSLAGLWVLLGLLATRRRP